jgi:hypothetical protein
MVTSQMMNENEMGNRGSKSNVSLNSFVKEQRVDGGYSLLSCAINNKELRCIPMAYENRYQTKISSKLITNIRKYSSSTLNNTTLNPWFISGFTDAEGSFIVKLSKVDYGIRWKVQLDFSIGLHIKDLPLLKLIQSFFGVGSIRTSGNTCMYSIKSLNEILTILIPHFVNYPLLTQKKADFFLFKIVAFIIEKGEHTNIKGLQEIVNIRASINRGLTSDLINAFPITKSVTRPEIQVSFIPNPLWIAGFASGDAGFFITLVKDAKVANGIRTRLKFTIAQHSKDKLLLKSFISYFNCGTVSEQKNMSIFDVQSFQDIQTKIVPFFLANPILGIKALDFESWCRVVDLISNKLQFTPQGLAEIQQIKENFNSTRTWSNSTKN